LFWAGPVAVFSIVRERVLLGVAVRIAIVLSVVFLAPLGSRLMRGTPWALDAGLRRRQRARAEGRSRSSDIVWAAITFLALAAAVVNMAKGVSLVNEFRHSNVFDGRPRGPFEVALVALILFMGLTGAVLLVSIPCVIARGAWRRTRWGYGPALSGGEPEPDAVDEILTPFAVGRTTRTAGAALAVAVVVFVVLLGGIVVQL
jgi:hypothetical protein